MEQCMSDIKGKGGGEVAGSNDAGPSCWITGPRVLTA